MLRIFRHYVPRLLLITVTVEALILMVSLLVTGLFALLASDGLPRGDAGALSSLIPSAMGFALAMLTGLLATGCYQRDPRELPTQTTARLMIGFLIGLALIVVIRLAVPGFLPQRALLLPATLLAFIGLLSARLIFSRSTESHLRRRVLVLGVGERAKRLEGLRRASDCIGIVIVGFVDVGAGPAVIDPARTIVATGALPELVKRFDVDDLVVALDDRRSRLPEAELLQCKMSGVRVLDDSQFLEQQQVRISLDGIKAGDFIFADGYTGAVLLRGSKRLLDVSIALLMLCVGLPIMAVVALAILLESGLPVIYVQERVGLHGKPFRLYKFRSMRQNAEGDGQPVWATKADQRVTRLGRFLRQTRLDELPQLFNVLLGDMSLVGPRPERPAFVSALEQEIPFYALRHQVKPGITGWAQICFPYGASSEDARQKLQYDLYYLKNYSLFLDLNILCLTLQVVLWGKGAR
jgi:sugar transferase (PEP-CTERM system associated)